MALRGHTKLELCNVKTGETQVYEDDNMFTDYLSDMIQPHFANPRSLLNISSDTNTVFSTQHLTGGVMMFSKPISEENGGDYCVDMFNNTMIAKASNYTYSGVDVTVGSYNSNLSVIGQNACTYVWDWTQERGNGSIACIGLTTLDGGKIGAGTRISPETSYVHSLFGKNTTVATFRCNDASASTTGCCRYFSTKTSSMFTTLVTWDGKLTVQEWEVPYDHYNVFRNKTATNQYNYFGTNYSKKLREEIFDLSATIAAPSNSYAYRHECISGSKYYIGSMKKCDYTTLQNWNTWNPGDALQFVVFDFEKWSYDTISVTNNTAEQLCSGCSTQPGNAYSPMNDIFVYKGYMYVVSKTCRVYAINLSNNADVKKVTYEDGNDVIAGSTGSYGTSYAQFCQLGNNLYLSRSGFYYNSWNGSPSYTPALIFTSVNTVRYIGMTFNIFNYYWNNPHIVNSDIKPYGLYHAGKYSGTNAESCHYDTLQLAYLQNGLVTINNLTEPVVKTADMTMRLTYTITNTDAEEEV